MKAHIFLFLTIVISGCSVLRPTDRITESCLLDFRPYSSADFFLSPNPYEGDFIPIGELTIDITPALKEPSEDVKFQDIYGTSKKLIPEVVPANEILDALVAKALDIGADGISNIKISMSTENVMVNKGIFSVQYMPVVKYHITGFCIKRK